MLIVGKNINMRTVNIDDAEFIYKMRQDKDKTKYLSKIIGTIETQKKWIKNYKQRESKQTEFYFVIKSKQGENLGLIRMYNFQNYSFCWGSWLIKKDAPKTTAIESALQIYELGFYTLGFKKSHFSVRKENNKVVKFHQRFGAIIVKENKLDYFFNLKKNDYAVIKERYKRYL